jgi:alpha-N-arabinofuranosidase
MKTPHLLLFPNLLLFPICLALAAWIAVMSPSFAQEPAPVAQWNFDTGAGKTAFSVGAGTEGTLEGNAGWEAGLTGAHALRLPGGDGFVDVPKAVVDTSRSFTVTACVKLRRANGWQTFVSQDGTQVSGFFLQLRGDSGEFAFTTLSKDDPASDTTYAGSKVDPLPDVWYHLAGIYDSTAQTLSLYVNGTLQQITPFHTPWHALGNTVIGRGKYGGNPVDYASATMDTVRLYNSALSAPQIAAIYADDLPAASRFDDMVRPGTIQIDAGRPGPEFSHGQHGIMTEEINHAYDGGLYAELVQNRTFQDDAASPVHWALVQDGGGTGTIRLDRSQPVSGTALTTCLRLDVSAPGRRVGVANAGYWGVPINPATVYHASFYAKAASGFTGPLQLSLESTDGKVTYAEAASPQVSGRWRQYSVTLKTRRAAPSLGRFVIAISKPGTLWLNQVSLFPPTYHNRPNGNRIDLMEKLAGQKPAFLRFPGGNYLEGDTIASRFNWEKTLGPLAQRPGHQTPWGYRSDDGLGLTEFLNWCSDLKMEPLLAVYAGYSLNHYQNPNPERVAPGPALQPFVQEALDEIEYVTGGPNTKWGAQRIKNGHPEPLPLRYVEVGNEDNFDTSGSYEGRFTQFYDAIKAKYPHLKIIATIPVHLRRPDLIDEHYYLPPRIFEMDIHHYDNYDRNGPKIFVGEWASQDGDTTATLNSALGDAAWMIGMEHNADIVAMETYAPLLVNVDPDAKQWPHPNLIGYDALTSFVSPSYWAQEMMVTHQGNVVLPTVVTDALRFAVSVTQDTHTGAVYVKAVNWAAQAQPMTITFTGAASIGKRSSVTVLTSPDLEDVNTVSEPRKIVPVTSLLWDTGRSFQYQFASHSVTVIEMPAQ